jgi:hypothetical protein
MLMFLSWCFKDWSIKCIDYKKYCEGIKEDLANIVKKKRRKLKRKLGCEGPECPRVIVYKDKLFAKKTKQCRERWTCL